MQVTSINNKHLNDTLEITNELEQVVAFIFSQQQEPLTTNEMLHYFYLYVNNLKDESAKTKITLAARNNALKAARTSLTHKGILKEMPHAKECKVTNRLVNCFVYTGIELTKREQILNEIQRRKDDIARCQEKIKELYGRLERGDL
jgi:hypothetical protein